MNIINYGVIFIIINYLLLIIVSKISNKVNYIEKFSSKIVRQYGLIISIFILYIVLIWWYKYDINNREQLINNLIIDETNGLLGSNIILGFDSISLYYCLLIGIIIPISILSGWYMKSNQSNLYILLILLIGILLWINFITLELLSYYILFESTLIPLFILIGIYGSLNKEKAAYYILLYTLFGSLFMLLSICITTYLLKSTNYYVYNGLIISLDLQIILWLGLFISIMVKSPLFPLHIWLPVVHSESPLAGSIILASLVLKLTIYLILRWMLPILAEGTLIFTPLVYVICLLTIILISLITIVQIDLKIIIAYSSISHMAVCILGIFSNNVIGIDGSYILSIAHGLVSPGLFIAVGGVLYDRYHTRILIYYNGLLSIMPLFSFYFIVLSFANIGTPLSANFIGEFLSSLGAFKTSPIIATICSFAILLSAAYQFKLTNRITGGTNYYIHNIGDVTKRESFMFIAIIIPTLIIGIYPQPIINNLSFIISSTIYN